MSCRARLPIIPLLAWLPNALLVSLPWLDPMARESRRPVPPSFAKPLESSDMSMRTYWREASRRRIRLGRPLRQVGSCSTIFGNLLRRKSASRLKRLWPAGRLRCGFPSSSKLDGSSISFSSGCPIPTCATSWRMYDNSGSGPRLIASGSGKTLKAMDRPTWKRIVAEFGNG